MKNLLFIITILSIPIGIIFNLFDIVGGNIFLALGFLGVFVFYLIRVIKDFYSIAYKKIIVLKVMIILMSFCLFTKYLYHLFGDYPSLIIVPVFLLSSIIYLLTERRKQTKLSLVTILYLLLSIPLFGFEFNNSPRHYIPQSWYDRYGETSHYIVSFDFKFDYPETKLLNEKAFDLKEKQLYYDAIEVYEEARKLEPKNLSLLFELSEAYARTNELEIAVELLDKAIIVDSSYSEFYNNRGLLFYKLKKDEKAIIDYEKAIELDPNQPVYHANLALVYFYQDTFDKACEEIQIAESRGFNLSDSKILREFKDEQCN
ncbi:tetratricopeptide repeat protein [Psychroserpens sp. Hel_I_66]|uniref:tetratricopeptide repeat protein n=1 Tax=Psychroserpens sp. Hel_I_66 TaxID=1250004 RepID=UPI0006463674|nr:tetratricopeptide repeat protein [Psychroserpens sp. Hel_I_66]